MLIVYIDPNTNSFEFLGIFPYNKGFSDYGFRMYSDYESIEGWEYFGNNIPPSPDIDWVNKGFEILKYRQATKEELREIEEMENIMKDIEDSDIPPFTDLPLWFVKDSEPPDNEPNTKEDES